MLDAAAGTKGRVIPREEWPEAYRQPLAPAFAALLRGEEPQGDAPAFYVRPPRLWRLLLVAPRQEKRLAEKLQKARLWAYWPHFVRPVRLRGGARRDIYVAVIPGYMLLAENPARPETWDVIHACPEVRGYVACAGGAPAALGEEHVELIRRIEAALVFPGDPSGFAVGDRVKFVDDLYWQLMGVVTAIAGDDRIGVEVEMLGRKVPIWTTAAQIERCS